MTPTAWLSFYSEKVFHFKKYVLNIQFLNLLIRCSVNMFLICTLYHKRSQSVGGWSALYNMYKKWSLYFK